ncbi:isopenicillin N synthase-like dioxygenase [Oxalobacteraceae bacterium GrIS 1.18]
MIPTIDLSPLFQETNGIHRVAEQLKDAYTSVGFAQIINHRIPDQFIQAAYRASKAFHDLPEAEKIQLRFKKTLRGYIPINASTLIKSEVSAATTPNQSESFIIGSELPNDHAWYGSALGGEQCWPAQLPDFQTQTTQYFLALKKLGQRLIQAFAIALGMPETALDQYFRNPNNFLRLLRYPPMPANASPDLYGSAPHTDYGCLTLLHQDEVGGLQVQLADQSWIDVEPQQQALVLNTGQMMAIWSNGTMQATRHRVINKGSGYRFSMPFFYDCDIDARVAPLPSCVNAEHPARYEPVIYGENLEKFVLANYRFS